MEKTTMEFEEFPSWSSTLQRFSPRHHAVFADVHSCLGWSWLIIIFNHGKYSRKLRLHPMFRWHFRHIHMVWSTRIAMFISTQENYTTLAGSVGARSWRHEPHWVLNVFPLKWTNINGAFWTSPFLWILVGGVNLPLWKMMEWKSVGMIFPFPTEWKVIIQIHGSSHHQPDMINPNIYIPMIYVWIYPVNYKVIYPAMFQFCIQKNHSSVISQVFWLVHLGYLSIKSQYGCVWK